MAKLMTWEVLTANYTSLGEIQATSASEALTKARIQWRRHALAVRTYDCDMPLDYMKYARSEKYRRSHRNL